MAPLCTPVPHYYPSIAFRDQIALAHPIGAEVVGDVEGLYVSETQRVQELICRVEVGAVAPRTAPAIKHDSRVLRQRLYAVAEHLLAFVTGRRSDIFSTWNVSLCV